MFAVISSGGKQYKVSNDTILTVNKLAGESGEKLTVNDVLFASDGKDHSLGNPNIKDAKVNFEIIKQDRDRKVLIFKKQRRKNFRRKNGHKQGITFLKVLDIQRTYKVQKFLNYYFFLIYALLNNYHQNL